MCVCVCPFMNVNIRGLLPEVCSHDPFLCDYEDLIQVTWLVWPAVSTTELSC